MAQGRNNYCTREHDSLMISNGKWCWYSQVKGKNARLEELNILLNMDQPHSEMVDDDDRVSQESEREVHGVER